jgi:hypothetical protein
MIWSLFGVKDPEQDPDHCQGSKNEASEKGPPKGLSFQGLYFSDLSIIIIKKMWESKLK